MKLYVFDGHCDTAVLLLRRKQSIAGNDCHVDLNKARVLDGYAQVFAFCSLAGIDVGAEPQKLLLELPLRELRSQVAAHADRVAFAHDGRQARSIVEQGRAAALLSLEGAELIDCDPQKLFALRDEGFVMTTLTWNADNALAGWHGSQSGLSDRGRAFVRAAEEAGILIDVSHLSERAFWQLAEYSQKPILASHSNCRAVWEHTRNLTDDQLRAIAQSGGTVGLNLYTDFLGENADFDTMLRHVEHAMRLCGEEHVALGGDLDGCESLPKGFAHIGSYRDFAEFLLSRGYDEALIDQLFFSNLARLLGGTG